MLKTIDLKSSTWKVWKTKRVWTHALTHLKHLKLLKHFKHSRTLVACSSSGLLAPFAEGTWRERDVAKPQTPQAKEFQIARASRAHWKDTDTIILHVYLEAGSQRHPNSSSRITRQTSPLQSLCWKIWIWKVPYSDGLPLWWFTLSRGSWPIQRLARTVCCLPQALEFQPVLKNTKASRPGSTHMQMIIVTPGLVDFIPSRSIYIYIYIYVYI